MIKEKIDLFAASFEEFLKSEFTFEDNEFAGHYKAMEYSLLSGGKRLRPFILSAFYKASGGKDKNFLNFLLSIKILSYSKATRTNCPDGLNSQYCSVLLPKLSG